MTTAIINSEFWQETAHIDDAFCTETAICCGYDVYGDMMQKATYFEYIYLMFKHERPTKKQLRAFEILAFALANPGPRDTSVHAAMGAGMSMSTSASFLIAALACSAGSNGGAREVYLSMQEWEQRRNNLNTWCEMLENPTPPTREEIWPTCEHPPGFSPYDRKCGKPVLQTLSALQGILNTENINFLEQNRLILEEKARHPLSMIGVTAACLTDLGFPPHVGEVLTLLLRLPGAAAHALEQNKLGFRQFPFFEIDLQNDPKTSEAI